MVGHTVQMELDFDNARVDGYLERKEGMIFAHIREICPGSRITYGAQKESGSHHFKVIPVNGAILQLQFTEGFLFYKSVRELRESIAYHLCFMVKSGADSRAVFTRSSVRIRNL